VAATAATEAEDDAIEAADIAAEAAEDAGATLVV